MGGQWPYVGASVSFDGHVGGRAWLLSVRRLRVVKISIVLAKRSLVITVHLIGESILTDGGLPFFDRKRVSSLSFWYLVCVAILVYLLLRG